jgi:hypothetical protein
MESFVGCSVRWIGDRGEVFSGGHLNEGLESLAEALTDTRCLPVEASKPSTSLLMMRTAKIGRLGASLMRDIHLGLVI